MTSLRPPRGVGLLALVAAVSAHPAPACDSPTSCLAEIERAQSRTKSLAASFTQTKYLSLLDEPLVSSGRFSFAPPSRVTWTIEKPEPLEVKIDGEHVELPGMSEDDRRHVAMTPIAAMFRQLGALFTGAAGSLQESFEVQASDSPGALDLVLRPRLQQGKKLFERIDLRFERPRLVLRRIEIHDPLGDRLVIELDDVEVQQGQRGRLGWTLRRG